MRIEFLYILDDYKAFLKNYAERSPNIKFAKRRSTFITFLLLASLALAAGAFTSNFWLFLGIIIITFGASLLQLYGPGVNNLYIKRAFAERNEGTFGDCAIEIDPDQLDAFWPSGSMSHKWSSFKEIVTTQTHTFFYISGMGAIILPNHSIKAGDYKAFIVQAKAYLGRTPL